MLFVQADQLEELVYALLTALCVVHAVDDHTLFNDGGNGHTRIQRSIRILENDLRFFRILETRCGVFQIQLFARHSRACRTLRDTCPWPRGRAWTCRSRTRRQGRAFRPYKYREEHVVDGLQHTAGNFKVLAYVVHERSVFHYCSSGSPLSAALGQSGWSSQHAAS